MCSVIRQQTIADVCAAYRSAAVAQAAAKACGYLVQVLKKAKQFEVRKVSRRIAQAKEPQAVRPGGEYSWCTPCMQLQLLVAAVIPLYFDA